MGNIGSPSGPNVYKSTFTLLKVKSYSELAQMLLRVELLYGELA